MMKKSMFLFLSALHVMAFGVDYTSTHQSNDTNSIIVIPSPLSSGGKDYYYMDALWGIEIIRVLCDGVVVEPKPINVDFNDVDLRLLKCGSGGILYQLSSHSFVSTTEFNLEKRTYKVVEYNLPKVSKEIEITYRIRTVLGKSATCRVVSYDKYLSNPHGIMFDDVARAEKGGTVQNSN